MPESRLEGWGRGLGRFAFHVVRIRRQVTLQNLRRAFPDWEAAKIHQVAEASYMHFGVVFLELMRLHRWSPEQLVARVHFPDHEVFRRLRGEERGVVIVSAHLGNWEIVGAALSARGYPISVMVKTQRNPHVDALVTANRESTGMRVLRVEDGLRPVLRTLRENTMVAFVADQDAGRHGVFLPHFGELASVAVGPARFARLGRSPVLVGFCLREPGGAYRVRISEPIRPREDGEVEDEERRILTYYLKELEATIRAHPEQYFWMHRRWKTRPPRVSPSDEA